MYEYKIKSILEKRFKIKNNISLLKQLSSIEIVIFIQDLENEFNIIIEAIEIEHENFCSIEAINKFIKNKLT